METRKLIKLGNSSFAVALPKTWIDKAGLKKGDDIFIEHNSNGELIVSPIFKKVNGTKEKSFNFIGANDYKSILREISVAYVQDYNLFNIQGIDRLKKEEVKRVLQGLVGIEIVEEEKDKITAKDFFDLNEANMERFLRRIDNTIRSIFDDIESSLKLGKISKSTIEEIKQGDLEINKFYLLINRLLIKGIDNPSVINALKTDTLTLFNNWWVSYNLEHIGDELKRIARLLKQDTLKEGQIKKILETISEIKKNYLNSLNSYYKNDKTLVMKIILERDNLMKKYDTLTEDKDGTVATIGEKFKDIVESIHQINKIIIYSLIV